MTTMEDQLNCFYLDSSKQNSSDMLRKCVQDNNSPYGFNCGDNPMYQEKMTDIKDTARINDIAIQRGMIEFYIENSNENNTFINTDKRRNMNFFNNTEGYQNYNENSFVVPETMGEKYVPEGKCPQGFGRCPKTGRCIQACTNCVYEDNMKSREFNEADPCFPDGVYNGITNEGYIKCTCGSENQYCSDKFINNLFTADGMIMVDKKILMMNAGETNSVQNLFDFGNF